MVPTEQTKLTLKTVEESLSRSVYAAGHWFERAEAAGLIRSNGRNLQQDLAQKAVEMLRWSAVHKDPPRV
jgi:hypothetical protein